MKWNLLGLVFCFSSLMAQERFDEVLSDNEYRKLILENINEFNEAVLEMNNQLKKQKEVLLDIYEILLPHKIESYTDGIRKPLLGHFE